LFCRRSFFAVHSLLIKSLFNRSCKKMNNDDDGDDGDVIPDDGFLDSSRQSREESDAFGVVDDPMEGDSGAEHDNDESLETVDQWRLKRNDSYRCAAERACGRPISIVHDERDIAEEELLERIAGSPLLPPTPEQRSLVLFTPSQHQRVVVNAYAGSGKTLACRMIAARFNPPWRVLYVVFNKEAAVQARRVMPPHVGCHTTHAFALAFMRDHTKSSNIEMSTAPDTDDCRVASALSAFWNDPIASDIVLNHVPTIINRDSASTSAGNSSFQRSSEANESERTDVMRSARRIWRCMINNTECQDCSVPRIPRWTFDAVLKYMALQRDASHRWLEERFDCVLVDEAQDTQQVLVGWYRELVRLPVYFVGDMHQAIYGFTGCRNAMEQFVQLDNTRVFHLTQSFRFGANLARLATTLLRSAGMLPPPSSFSSNRDLSSIGGGASQPVHNGLRGRDDMHCVILAARSNELTLQSYLQSTHGRLCIPITYISRSNSTALDHAFDTAHSRRRVRILGALHEQVVGAGQLVQTRFRHILPGGALSIRPLLKRKRTSTMSSAESDDHDDDDEQSIPEQDDQEDDDGRGQEPLLYALKQLEAKIMAARRGGINAPQITDAEKHELDAMRIIKKYGSAAVRTMIDAALVESDEDADVIVGTAHSTKGLEFDLVVLGDDFYPLSIMRRFFSSIGERASPSALSRAEQKYYLRVAEANESDSEVVKNAQKWIQSREEPIDAIASDRDALTAVGGGPLTVVQKMHEEVHLYYVALTRARHALILNKSLDKFYGRNIVEPMPEH
jgi:superfamily I DNA/RNA helicase